jgi:hypothetical protein
VTQAGAGVAPLIIVGVAVAYITVQLVAGMRGPAAVAGAPRRTSPAHGGERPAAPVDPQQ